MTARYQTFNPNNYSPFSSTKRKRIGVDVLLGIISVSLLVSLHSPVAVHVALGVALLFALVAHIYQHRRWFGALGRGTWNRRRIYKTVFSLSIALFLLSSTVSGLVGLFAEHGSLHHITGFIALFLCVVHPLVCLAGKGKKQRGRAEISR